MSQIMSFYCASTMTSLFGLGFSYAIYNIELGQGPSGSMTFVILRKPNFWLLSNSYSLGKTLISVSHSREHGSVAPIYGSLNPTPHSKGSMVLLLPILEPNSCSPFLGSLILTP